MALYIPHSIFHLARPLYVRPETFGPYYVYNLSAWNTPGFEVLRSALLNSLKSSRFLRRIDWYVVLECTG